MRGRLTVGALVALMAVGATLTAAASGAVPRAAHFDGRVVAIDRADRSVAVRDDESGTVRVRVTRATRFERIAGFGGLRRGLDVEVTARRSSSGKWIATEIERRRTDDERGRRGDGRGGSGGRESR